MLFGFGRNFLAPAILVSALAIGTVRAADQDNQSFQLLTRRQIGELSRVQVVLEVDGKLDIKTAKAGAQQLPLSVAAKMLYDEQILDLPDDAGQPVKSARFYRKAQADLAVDKREQKIELSPSRRLIVQQAGQDGCVMVSPLGALERNQLDLIDVPGNSAVLDALLPDEPVKIGDHWSHNKQLLTPLLGLDEVTESSIESHFKTVEEGVAKIELSGSASGTIAGAKSEMRVKAKYFFNLNDQMITWLIMDIQEERARGPVEPGFVVQARLQMVRAHLESSRQLSEEFLQTVDLEISDNNQLLAHISEERAFQFHHDRSWHVMAERPEVTILRKIVDGKLVAQCNISSLIRLPHGQQRSLDEFQKDIQGALGKVLAQLDVAEQGQTGSGLSVLRVVASGTVSKLPIQWIYYHLAGEDGRRASYVFTLEVPKLEKFAGADETIIESFEFLPQEQEGEETSGVGQVSPTSKPPASPSFGPDKLLQSDASTYRTDHRDGDAAEIRPDETAYSPMLKTDR